MGTTTYRSSLKLSISRSIGLTRAHARIVRDGGLILLILETRLLPQYILQMIYQSERYYAHCLQLQVIAQLEIRSRMSWSWSLKPQQTTSESVSAVLDLEIRIL